MIADATENNMGPPSPSPPMAINRHKKDLPIAQTDATLSLRRGPDVSTLRTNFWSPLASTKKSADYHHDTQSAFLRDSKVLVENFCAQG